MKLRADFRLILLAAREIERTGNWSLPLSYFAFWTVRLGGWLPQFDRCSAAPKCLALPRRFLRSLGARALLREVPTSCIEALASTGTPASGNFRHPASRPIESAASLKSLRESYAKRLGLDRASHRTKAAHEDAAGRRLEKLKVKT